MLYSTTLTSLNLVSRMVVIRNGVMYLTKLVSTSQNK